MKRLFFVLTIFNGISIPSVLSSIKKDNIIFHENIMKLTKNNNNFRHVLATSSHSQIVLMSLKSGEDIGNEVHSVDQALVFIEGEGIAYLKDKKYNIAPGDIFLVPEGVKHNFINTGSKNLKLFTIYSPPEFEQGVIQALKPKANEDIIKE